MKLLKIAGVAVLTAFAAAASGPAAAFPAYWDEYEYFSDASMTEMVGSWGQTCQGTTYSWGRVTPYRVQTMHYWCNNIKGPLFPPL